jgi:chloride channel protein, CIC family
LNVDRTYRISILKNMTALLPASLQRRLARLQPSSTVILGALAILVGLLTGVGVWLFKLMITWAHVLFFGWLGGALAALGPWTVALLPTLGGLLVGLLWYRWVGEERYHGVAGIMEAVALVGGRLQYRLGPVKTIAAALSIGSGASVGPEDPSVQIGANLGSLAGQKLRFSDDWIRTLVAAGVAAGISAAFNAPIAGVFFALEIVMGEIGGSALFVIVLAAVTSAVFTQSVSGSAPAFRVPAYAFHSAEELPLYLVLGVLAGLVAVLYITALYMAKDLFGHWAVPGWLKTAAAGLAVGVVGIWLPQIFGVGYDTIGAIFNGPQMALSLLLVLLFAKLALTAVSIGGGFPGGVFAPSLFLGATLGDAYGALIQGLFPGLMIAPQAYAMVGMAAVLAAAVHAPLTAILLLFEMTQDYRIILPLMAAVIVGLLLAQRLRGESVYSMALSRKGLRLQRGRDVEVLEGITVGEVMETDSLTLQEADSIANATDLFARTRHHGLPVVNGAGDLVGILTVQDIERADASGDGTIHTVGDACTRDLEVTYRDESIGTALRRMSLRDIGRLPVVDREDPCRMVGVLRRTDLVRAYDVALTRRTALRHRSQRAKLGAVSGETVAVEEYVIEAAAPCDGQAIKDISWPRDCVIASLRRGRRVLIPHGDTVLRAGDTLVIVVEDSARAGVQRLCIRA